MGIIESIRLRSNEKVGRGRKGRRERRVEYEGKYRYKEKEGVKGKREGKIEQGNREKGERESEEEKRDTFSKF